MTPSLFILSCDASAAQDSAFRKLAELLGLEAEVLPIRPELLDCPAKLKAGGYGKLVLAISQMALSHLINQEWFIDLVHHTPFMLVYGFAPSDIELPELKILTKGRITSAIPLQEGRRVVKIHSDVEHRCFPVTGQSYAHSSSPVAAFAYNSEAGKIESYISVNGSPYFLSLERGDCNLFLLAEESLVDIDTVLPPEGSLRGWYAQLIAVAIFLRVSCRSHCWSAPVTPANFIVDDPYLKKRYGFIHYETIMADLEKSRSALTIAFIPYNFKRSHSETVDLLRRNSGRFSIAVHGCDHTVGEFASLDESWLEGTAGCALQRIETHENAMGLPFDNVMIFPHGRFSTKAIRALKKCGYAAAVNSTAWPVDHAINPLTIRDLLSVAVTRFESFAIFVRRYPRDVFDFAFDVLFQKPVLGVEHHGYFRKGSALFLNIVKQLSELRTQVIWMPLGQAVEKSCVVRKKGEGEYVLRHFAPVLRFRNTLSKTIVVQIEKPEEGGEIDAVLVGGRKVTFEICSGFIRYTVKMHPGENLNANIIYRKAPRQGRKVSMKYQMSAWTRRILSEVRDNYIARSDSLLSLAEKAKSILSPRDKLD